MIKRLLLASTLLMGAGLPFAALAQEPVVAPVTATALPLQLGPNARDRYRDIFASIEAGQWSDAQAKLDAMDEGPLHAEARAAIYLGKGSPKVDGEALAALATRAPDLPEAPALVRLATVRGALDVPLLPEAHSLSFLGSSPRRGRVASTEGDPMARTMADLILPLIKDDRPIEAEAVLIVNEDELTADAATEWRQRVAWSYFLSGDDAGARALALQARQGTGEWGAMSDWVIGLSAWRQKDWTDASDAFASVARRSTDPEMIAAGHYWAARADMAAKRPERIQPHLRLAAQLEETFYGLLAQQAMGLPPVRDDDGGAAIRQVAERPNVRAALALAEIGALDRADALLRWQARIGLPTEHATLALIAG
ncbi:MAG: lytic transglycosylase domain-containing protein, partial [Sphingomonadaceae bacterium]|nr:lytic transglycosylase domain-containing protein [Sphingomonadaceae bacterium]